MVNQAENWVSGFRSAFSFRSEMFGQVRRDTKFKTSLIIYINNLFRVKWYFWGFEKTGSATIYSAGAKLGWIQYSQHTRNFRRLKNSSIYMIPARKAELHIAAIYLNI
jgi:hypothetical protein